MPFILSNKKNSGQLKFNRSDTYTNESIVFNKRFTGQYIISKELVGTQNLTVGATITKDMNLPTSLLSVPSQILTKYIYPGTSIPPTTGLQRWSDWNGDIFDGWGHFYLYDPELDQYYIPVLSPVNQSDGVIQTQTYSAFNGRTFTIKHGYPAQGIFRFIISVDDDKEFSFGAYGDMGSDSGTINTNLTSSFLLNNESYNLYYNRNSQGTISAEVFYSYIVPYETQKNKNTITYTKQNSGPGINNGALEVFSFYTVNVKGGITIYFSKSIDVKDWVINDLKVENFWYL